MQIGRLEMMEQAQVDYVSKISKIQEADQKTKVDPDEKYKNLLNKDIPTNNETILDNVKFGYNEDTNEFFVRITKGNQEYQYPTEDMFRLKKSLMDAYKDTQNS
ncbi:MAG: flagellin [Campylobacterota bacterium]|nr:flagellin [Campylobacterota bacterium]